MAADYVNMNTGPFTASDGVNNNRGRSTRTGEQAVQLVHPSYWEAVSRGSVYSASIAAAGVAPGTALSTSPAFQIYNPTGSGKNLVMLQSSLSYISGTLGAGAVVYSVWGPQVAAPTGGTALTVRNALVGGGSAGSATGYTGSTISGTSLLLRPMCGLGASLASTAVNPWVVKDQLDGEFVIAPGYVFCIQGITAAGSTPLVVISATWEEVTV
jgi:hypothetical protein